MACVIDRLTYKTFATLAGHGDLVAIVGAGGKTSTMFALAAALAGRGMTVITTKSTTVHRPTLERGPPVAVIAEERWAAELPSLLRRQPVASVVTAAPSERRWDGVRPESAAWLMEASGADVVIVEADGARGRLLKSPADHEPAMPPQASIVMPVTSLRAVGQQLAMRHVHRPEHVAAVLHLQMYERLTVEHIGTLVLSPESGLKSAPANARVWPVLTSASQVPQSDLEALIGRLSDHPRVAGCVVAWYGLHETNFSALRTHSS